MLDLKITNANIIDGTGEASFEGSIGIQDGIITAVGEQLGAATREIDAQGHMVTPGFVDIHTHYDGRYAGTNI
jgi:N-acyl-D-amino-acid deacylase